MTNYREVLAGYKGHFPKSDLEAVKADAPAAQELLERLRTHAGTCHAEFCGQCDEFLYVAMLIRAAENPDGQDAKIIASSPL